MDRSDVKRAEWQLWTLAFVILAALAGATIYLVAGSGQTEIAGIPSLGILEVALGALVIAFATYAVDRERGLKRLTDDLIAEQLSHERLAARVAALAELTRERDTSTALLEASADGVAVIDATMTIVRFNAAMEALTGTARTLALGSNAVEVLDMVDGLGVPLEGLGHPLRAVFADGVARARGEMQLRRPDGSIVWVSATFSPILENGAPAFVLLALRDIAAQKESEVMQRDFVSMAAHELRSPLTAIKGFTRTLMTRFDQLTDERRTHYLGVVNEQSNRLARLVDDLMQVSRIDARTVYLEPEPVDVAEVVSALRDQFRSQWSDRDIELDVEAGLVPALADAHKFEEILINLIDNAVKYSPAGAPIHVGVRSCSDGIEVSVRDHGDGISPDDLDKLFTKFQRLSANASEVPGTGLGLYIVKGLIEAHGGRVWVDSVVGRGSTFCFTVPAALDRVVGDGAHVAAEAGATG